MSVQAKEDTRTRSINRKLAQLVAIAIGSAMMFIAVLGAWQEASRYLDGKRDILLATANAFAAASADALAAGNERGVNLALRGIAAIPTIQFADLSDGTGHLFASIGSGVRLQGDLDISDGDRARTPLGLLTTHTVSVAVPVRTEGREIGRLQLVGDVSDLWARLADALVPVAYGAAAALAIGLAISLRLQRSITRPLIALTAVMSNVQARHDYDAQVTVDSNDEIGVLARSFNGMLGEVRQRDQALVAHRDRLEQDVAERTQDLKLAKDDAEAANAAKSDFLATMSHEIRTPMNGMLVMADLLAGSNLPERQRRYAEVIARSGQSLMAILNDILDFSKIEAGKLTLEEISFSLPDVIDTVVTLFAERASAKGLDLAAYLPSNVPTLITGDPVRLTQVLSNLVNNALKFTETGHVLVAAERVGEQLHLHVRDTGIGIPAEKVGGIFSAFTQADQSTTRKFGGTGLGLAISKRIVEAMAGDIAVASVEGSGSTFSVVIPLSNAPLAPFGAPAPSGSVEVRLSGSATMDSAARSLTDAGFAVVPAASTVDRYVVADTLDLIQRSRDPSAVRVVGVSAIGDPSGAEALRRGLADVLIRRPIVQAEWREVVARFVDGLPFASDLPATKDPVAAFAAGLDQLHVLVADDSAVNREVACEALARLGISAEAATGGGGALEALRSRQFDLVLMDGSMPDIDGYEVTRIIRREEAHAGRVRLPIVALTAHVIGPAADLWRSAGMDDVLHKPFTIAALAEIISRNVGPGRVRGEPESAIIGGSAVQGAVDEADLLDLETLLGLEDMAGSAGSDFLERIVGLFADGAQPCFTDLRAASARSDATAVASSAHKLKSMSLNVGGASLASRLAGIESAALDDARVPAPEIIDAAEDCYRLTLATIRSRLFDGHADALAA